MFKKLFALICAFVMLACIPVAQAADDFASFIKVPETTTYRGGVVMRGYVRGADTSLPPLDIAYTLTSMPYIVIGQPTNWEVVVSGGTGEYTCQAALYWQEINSAESVYYGLDTVSLTGKSFSYTFTEEGRYFWEFRVMDSSGAYFAFQTSVYEAYTQADETNDQTVVGKANSIVAEVITPDMSTYARARVLHDWLTENANYDYTFTNSDAAGVLLRGTGVCESYARAYLMLCTIAGIDCIYVSGDGYSTDHWVAHAWNMIKLDDGKWYHVDCTWDDPGTGGYENHDYFCIDDEQMAKDHRWNTPDGIVDTGNLPPDSDGGIYEDADDNTGSTYHFTFSTVEEYNTGLDKLIAANTYYGTIYGKYTGSEDPIAFFQSSFGPWTNTKTTELSAAGLLLPSSPVSAYITGDNLFAFSLPWATLTSYIRIEESTLRVTVGESTFIIPSEYYPHNNSFTWTSSDPSVATVTATYDAENGLIATVTGVSAGTATITVKPQGGTSDTVTVTVLPAYAPDFGLTLTETSSGVTLDWNTIPGITEYQVIRVVNGTETVLATTTSSECELTSSQLPDSVSQKVYILAQRKVGSNVTASYKSDPVSYGTVTIPTFNSTLPAKMKEIGADAFADCTSLTSFDIPSGVTTIGERAFAGCTSLINIRIPASVTSIGTGAFSSCPLEIAVVEQGSYADTWLKQNCPNVTLIY